MLAPQDERNFKTLCAVLKKDMDRVEMLDVKYSHLEMLKPVIKTATDLEKTHHRRQADEKAASWLLKTAKDAELVMDDDLKHEVQGKLSGSKRLHKSKEGEDPDENIEKPLFKTFDDVKIRERNRAKQREIGLKSSYDKERSSMMLKKFGKSSFLTPEAAMYLNDVVKNNQTKVDDEVVYAGLHNEKLNKMKFKRQNKNQQRFKNRTKRSQKKTNRHAT